MTTKATWIPFTPDEALAVVRALRYVNDATYGTKFDKDDHLRHQVEARLERALAPPSRGGR